MTARRGTLTASTHCWIYRSPRRPEMYLYLAEEARFKVVPEPLLQRFGTPSLVMELELHPERKLAREDVSLVLQNLRAQGFHLQMPPEIRPHLYQGE